MKKIISVLIILTLLLTGCNVGGMISKKGSGNPETKTFELRDFKNVSASHVFDVTIERSEEFSVEVTYDDNLTEHIQVEVKGDTLKLSMDNKYNYNDVDLNAIIKMPDIDKIKGSGVTSFEIKEGFEFDHDFKVDLSGVSSLIGTMKTGDIDIDVSGSGNVTLNGSGKELSCDLSGASDANLEKFKVDNADIELSGSSDAIINTDGKINIDASGASDLKYKGDATIESIDVSGAADVEKIK